MSAVLCAILCELGYVQGSCMRACTRTWVMYACLCVCTRRIMAARHLPAMDRHFSKANTTDAYARISIPKDTLRMVHVSEKREFKKQWVQKTKVITNLNPEWDEYFYLKIYDREDQSEENHLTVGIFDYDKKSRDDKIGVVHVPLTMGLLPPGHCEDMWLSIQPVKGGKHRKRAAQKANKSKNGFKTRKPQGVCAPCPHPPPL